MTAYQQLTEAQFNELVAGKSKAELTAEAVACRWNDPEGCEASSPGGTGHCLFCRHSSAPDDHPWKALSEALQ